jgi:type I restriction enzyme M protein
MMDENSGEDGLLSEVIDGEGDKQKISAKVVKSRLKEIGKDDDFADELKILQEYVALLDEQANLKSHLKVAQEDLTEKLAVKYPQLSEDDVKNLIINDKWLATLNGAVQAELARASQILTGRIRQLAERYSTPLAQLTKDLLTLSSSVDAHLKKMGML